MVDRLRAYEDAGSADAFIEIRNLRRCLEEAPRPVDWAMHNSSIAQKIGLGADERLFVGS
jgi:hypothetical protein